MQLNQKIKKRRRSLGLKADDIARTLGVSRATLYRYESSDIGKIPARILEPLAKILKTTPEYLLGLDPEEEAPELPEAPPDTLSLPVFESVYSRSGSVFFGLCQGEQALPRTVLKDLSPEEFFWMKAKENTLEPQFFENDLILVHKQNEVEKEAYGVVSIDEEESIVRQITYEQDTLILALPGVSAFDQTFTGHELARVKIIGKVLGSKRELDAELLQKSC